MVSRRPRARPVDDGAGLRPGPASHQGLMGYSESVTGHMWFLKPEELPRGSTRSSAGDPSVLDGDTVEHRWRRGRRRRIRIPLSEHHRVAWPCPLTPVRGGPPLRGRRDCAGKEWPGSLRPSDPARRARRPGLRAARLPPAAGLRQPSIDRQLPAGAWAHLLEVSWWSVLSAARKIEQTCAKRDSRTIHQEQNR